MFPVVKIWKVRGAFSFLADASVAPRVSLRPYLPVSADKPLTSCYRKMSPLHDAATTMFHHGDNRNRIKRARKMIGFSDLFFIGICWTKMNIVLLFDEQPVFETPSKHLVFISRKWEVVKITKKRQVMQGKQGPLHLDVLTQEEIRNRYLVENQEVFNEVRWSALLILFQSCILSAICLIKPK